MDAVEVDAATDAKYPQPFQNLWVQAGGTQALPVKSQHQLTFLALKKHLRKAGYGWTFLGLSGLPGVHLPPTKDSPLQRTQKLAIGSLQKNRLEA